MLCIILFIKFSDLMYVECGDFMIYLTSVCRMWRELGLKVFQVGNPHIEF